MTVRRRRAQANGIGWLSALSIAVAAGVYAHSVAPMVAAKRVDSALAARITSRLRAEEPAMRRGALQTFAGDRWSAEDDFANRERRFVREQAAQYGVSISSLLRAIDDDVRQHPRGADGLPRASVAPCMPRPFYD